MILQRLPDSRYSTVVREWEGATIVLIGGGPSLTVEQIALVKAAHEAGKLRCIAVNDAYLWAPFADVSYFADAEWFNWHTNGVAKPAFKLTAAQVRERFAGFAGQKCSIQSQAANIADDAVHILRNKHFPIHGNGISLDPGALVTGRHGLYQSLNLAILAGAKTIILLGADGKAAADGKTHFHGGHPAPVQGDPYQEYRRAFSAGQDAIKATGVRVINASPGSAIDTFPKVAIEEALVTSPEM